MQELTAWDEAVSPTSKVTAITGTPMYAAVSVLSGGPHTVNSMLKGLFYSVLSMRPKAVRQLQQELFWQLYQQEQHALGGDVASVRPGDLGSVRWHSPAHTGSPQAILAQECT